MTTVIALETATEQCSVALLHDGRVLERSSNDPRRHAEQVLPLVDQLLAQAGIGRNRIDAIAFGRGPGAFTGVRLACAVAQGLAFGLDRPTLPVSTLAALAQEALERDASLPVLALIDARMGEVYAGCFRADQAGMARLEGCEWLTDPTDLMLPGTGPWQVIGSGMVVYRPVLLDRLGKRLLPRDLTPWPRAAQIARLGAAEYLRSGGLAPDLALPVYLRDRVALTEAERASRG